MVPQGLEQVAVRVTDFPARDLDAQDGLVENQEHNGLLVDGPRVAQKRIDGLERRNEPVGHCKREK